MFSLVQVVPSFCLKEWLWQVSVSIWRQIYCFMKKVKIAGTEMRSGSPLSKVSAAASSAMKKKKKSLVKFLYLTNRIRKLVSDWLKPLERLKKNRCDTCELGTILSLAPSCVFIGWEYNSSPRRCPVGTGGTLFF